ncbi:MAG: hypothetical protein CL693_06995 [Cellvibrionaceae bacterium]|nr:hypothetical protein [Cellvibrionaceae bacterium]
MNNFKKTALSAVIAATGSYSMATTAETFALEEVVVTAQKREESLQDVPISVSAMSGDKITEAGIQNFEDVSSYIPNFIISQDSIGDKINIRGIQSGTQAGFEQSVGTFVDGVYRGRGVQSRFSFLDIGMVEVLRGPQGTLFGKNTVAGALNIRSAKPTEEFESKLRVSHNVDFDETEISGHVSGSLSDTVRARAAFMTREMKEGWVDNDYYGGDDDPQTDEWAGRVSVEWDASDNTMVSFKYEHGDWDNNGQPFEVVKVPDSLSAVITENSLNGKTSIGATDPVLDMGSSQLFEGDIDEYSLTVEHEFDGMTLTAIAGYSEYEYERGVDADFSNLNLVRFDDNEEFEQKSFEVRLASDTGGAFEYIAGLYYQDAELFTDGLSQINIPTVYGLLAGGCGAGVTALGGDPTAVVVAGDALGTIGNVAGLAGGGSASLANACSQQALVDGIGGPGALDGVARYASLDQDTEAWAAFGQMTWNIEDDLRLTVGLRYTEEEKEATQMVMAPAYTVGNRSVPAAGLASLASQAFLEFNPHEYDDLQRDEESFTWSLNLQYDINEDIMTYASASTGFKAGGFNSFYMGKPLSLATGTPGSDNKDDAEFEEEEVMTFELGAKMSLLDGSAELNLAYFYTEYDDLQASVFSGQTTFEVQNAAEATTQGIEIDGRWQASENLMLSGSFGWGDFEYDSFSNQACTNTQFIDYREAQWNGGTNPAAAGLNNSNCSSAGINDQKGEAGANTPEFSATLSAEYTQQIGNFGLRYNVDVIYMDEMYRQDDRDDTLLADSTTKVNASILLTPESESWDIAIIAQNLTDVDDDIFYGQDMPLVNGAVFAGVNPPRSVTIAGTLRF